MPETRTRLPAARRPQTISGPRAARLPPLVAPTVLLGLGLAQIGQGRALWYDEAYTRLAAGVPVSTLLSGVWHRVGVASYLRDVPPSFNGPFYLLMHGWVGLFGDSAAMLRLPSLLCAAAAVGVLGELLRRLAGPGAALTGGLLLATSPLMVVETTQARSYGAALLALAVCALQLYPAPGGPPHRRRAAGWAAMWAVVAALLHWFTIPVLLGLALHSRDRRTTLLLLAACVPAGLLVGWSLLGGTYGSPHPPAVGLALPLRAVEDWAGGLTALAVALVGAALLGAVRAPGRRLSLCWFGVSVGLISTLELVRPTYFSRYLLFALVGLVLAAALGLATLRPTWLRRGLDTALVTLSLVATAPTFGAGPREPVPATVAYLETHQHAGQPIVAADGRVALDLTTYLSSAPRLKHDLVLPPERFTTQTPSHVVWLVRVVLHEDSLPVVPAEQRLTEAGWSRTGSRLLVGSTTDLRVERWTR